jgi:hypothetical protein
LRVTSAWSDTISTSFNADDFISKLEKLGKLRDQKILTEDEFQKEKEKILKSRDE